MKYEDEFNQMLEKQIRTATGQRLERLKKDKTGERRLYCEVLRPVLPNLDDLVLEYEMFSIVGARIYLDMFIPRYRWAPECVGYVSHAQNITRERFDFEQLRIQTMAVSGMMYIPFSWDQLDKRPDQCRRVMYELIGRLAVDRNDDASRKLSIYEKEILRYALFINRPFDWRDVSVCTQLKEDACRRWLRELAAKRLIKPVGKGNRRFHDYEFVHDSNSILHFRV